MSGTPTKNSLDCTLGGFASLAEALDFAARGKTGLNIYDRRRRLTSVLTYRDLRTCALDLATRLRGLDLPEEARVALVAETDDSFLKTFFACHYAGLVPVPLPVAINVGGRDAYIARLSRMLKSCRPDVVLGSQQYSRLLKTACEGQDVRFVGSFDELLGLRAAVRREPVAPGLAYIQYTSGSTRFPRGVMVSQEALAANLHAIMGHLEVAPTDRCSSWLPFYHDMGLVGMLLAPLAAQRSVDYLPTPAFAMAPLQWLSLISENAATIVFGPPLGYELCTRRLRGEQTARFRLDSVRVAGVGAEEIRPASLKQFAAAFATSGFNPDSFMPSYGMAECSLALTFPDLGSGVLVDRTDVRALEFGTAPRLEEADERRTRIFVRCGKPLLGHDIKIVDDGGFSLPERRVGTLFARGPSLMMGYFDDPDSTAQALTPDGWLDTGDVGYRVDGDIVITGRKQDMIVVRGRNIWPQDLEALAEEMMALRPGEALAFASPDSEGESEAMIFVQLRRSMSAQARARIARELSAEVRRDFGIDCGVEIVASLPLTSSGKLSRSAARQEYEQRHRDRSPDIVYELRPHRVPEAEPTLAASPPRAGPSS